MWDADSNILQGNASSLNQRLGGSGWFGTVGAGYDWQLGGSVVAGVFGDGMFGSLKGSIIDNVFARLAPRDAIRSAAAGPLVHASAFSWRRTCFPT
jgi:outer membrane immunogenic protein